MSGAEADTSGGCSLSESLCARVFLNRRATHLGKSAVPPLPLPLPPDIGEGAGEPTTQRKQLRIAESSKRIAS